MYPIPEYIESLLHQVLEPLEFDFVTHDAMRETNTAKPNYSPSNDLHRNTGRFKFCILLCFNHSNLSPFLQLAGCPGLYLDVLHSLDFFSYTGPLLIVLQSMNPSCAGLWDITLLSPAARKPVSFEDLKDVCQVELIEEAHKRGYRVALVNLNFLVMDEIPDAERAGSSPDQTLLYMFDANLAFRRLGNVEIFGRRPKASRQNVSALIDFEDYVKGDLDFDERFQAWIERAVEYWSSLTSKVKAVAFVNPAEMFVESDGWSGGVFDVSPVVRRYLDVPQPESVKKWFIENSVQYNRSEYPLGEPLLHYVGHLRPPIPEYSAGTIEDHLVHKNVMTRLLDYFDSKLCPPQ
ncbi:hypothetical protein Aperf_G00000055772 [Anoplocephala perfoliata]